MVIPKRNFAILIIFIYYLTLINSSNLECLEMNLNSLFLPKEADCTSISTSSKEERCCFLSYKNEFNLDQIKCVLVKFNENDIKKTVSLYNKANLFCNVSYLTHSIINILFIFMVIM